MCITPGDLALVVCLAVQDSLFADNSTRHSWYNVYRYIRLIFILLCAVICYSLYPSEVRLSASHNSKTTRPNLTKFLHVVCGRGSILLGRRCNMLCTSGFTDDARFHTMGPTGRIKHDVTFRRVRQVAVTVARIQCLVEFVRMRHRRRSLLSAIALYWKRIRVH